jgi:hypothetical protein
MTEPHLSVVATDQRPQNAYPTPADVRRRQIADELLDVLEDAAGHAHPATTTAVVDVPVVNVPMRRELPRAEDTFTARVVDEDRPGAPAHLVHGVTHWRIHDGALSLYGPRDADGRSIKLQTINPLHWTRVERLAGGAQ